MYFFSFFFHFLILSKMTDEIMYFVNEAHGQAACTNAQHIIHGIIQCLPVQGFEKTSVFTLMIQRTP
jgi:hypothetical protein